MSEFEDFIQIISYYWSACPYLQSALGTEAPLLK